MPLNLNATPYHDDFDETKNFYRILFKPGFAVQARELTQLQTILQEQIKKFANHIFLDGSRINDDPSSVTITRDRRSVKLADPTNVSNIATLNGYYVIGETSNTYGVIEFVYDKDDPVTGDPTTIVFKPRRIEGQGVFLPKETLYFYPPTTSEANVIAKANTYTASEVTLSDVTITSSSSLGGFLDELYVNNLSAPLLAGDEVVIEGFEDVYITEVLSSNLIRVNKNIGTRALTNSNVKFIRRNTTKTMVVTVGKGSYYKNGFFVNVNTQSIVPQKYTIFPNKSVILRYSESITSSSTDNSLLDPAFGYSNYLAPGADRLKIELLIDSVDLNTAKKPEVSDRYIEVVRIINGKDTLIEPLNSIYSTIGDELAERTYTESGNYIVDAFTLTSAGSLPSGESNRFFVSKGRAFIGGRDIKTADKTEISIRKSRETDFISEETINTYYGNYVLIDSPKFGLYNPEKFSYYYWWECHNTTDRSAMNGTTLVGYIAPKFIKYDSGSENNSVYRLYWYAYEQANPNLSPESIKSIISVQNDLSIREGNDGTFSSPKFFANVTSSSLANVISYYTDPITNVVIGTATEKLRILESSKKTSLIFPTGKNYIKSVDNINMVYQKYFGSVSAYSGIATVNISSPEKFVGPAGMGIPLSLSRPHYIITSNVKGDSVTTYAQGDSMKLERLLLSLDSNRQSLTIDFDNSAINGTFDIVATVENNETAPRIKTLVENYSNVYNVSNVSQWYSLHKSDIFSLKNVFKVPDGTTYSGNYDVGTTYDSNSLVNYNGLVYLNVSGSASTGDMINDSNVWSPLTQESLLLYTLDNGQRDTVYDWGRLMYTGISAPGDVIVVFDYFTHSGSGPIVTTSYTANVYTRIPTYESKTEGVNYTLRDCIDFRPRREDDLVSPELWVSNDHVKPDPLAVPGTQGDLTYYLSRIDRVYLENKDNEFDPGNRFRIVEGTPAINPQPPNDESDRDTMLVATLLSPAYTASASDVKIVYADAPRYTMKDIENIDKRLETVEKKVKRQQIDLIALNNKVFDRGGAGGTTQISGNVLYTTHIFVDDFSNYDSGLVQSPYFTVALDTERQEARPAFAATGHKLFFNGDPDVSYYDDLITLNYTEANLIAQYDVTGTMLVNPGGASIGLGAPTFNPPTFPWAGRFLLEYWTPPRNKKKSWLGVVIAAVAIGLSL